jgi:acyl-coenzyme A synthetase/AMP-(fatty) acid ligase
MLLAGYYSGDKFEEEVSGTSCKHGREDKYVHISGFKI